MGFIRERGLILWVGGVRSESNPYFIWNLLIDIFSIKILLIVDNSFLSITFPTVIIRWTVNDFSCFTILSLTILFKSWQGRSKRVRKKQRSEITLSQITLSRQDTRFRLIFIGGFIVYAKLKILQDKICKTYVSASNCGCCQHSRGRIWWRLSAGPLLGCCRPGLGPLIGDVTPCV